MKQEHNTKKYPSLGEGELEIMKVLWQAAEPLPTQAINSAVAHIGWKRTTVSTFLARLVEKGAVACEKVGNQYFYHALLLEKEHRKHQTEQLIDALYGGCAKNLAVALFEETPLSAQDVSELRAFLDKFEEDE